MYICICTYTNSCVYSYVYIWHNIHTHKHIHKHTYICIHIYTYVYTYIYIYIYVYTYICIRFWFVQTNPSEIGLVLWIIHFPRRTSNEPFSSRTLSFKHSLPNEIVTKTTGSEVARQTLFHIPGSPLQKSPTRIRACVLEETQLSFCCKPNKIRSCNETHRQQNRQVQTLARHT